ncbi:MAG: response regulator [bacterium]
MMKNRLVMVVEDDPVNRELALKILNYYNYPTCSAVNGEDALLKIEKNKPALILMDLSLPVLDGWDTTKKIRENKEYDDIVIVALTAHAMLEDKERALKAGCNVFLSKPYDPKILLEVLNKYIVQEK